MTLADAQGLVETIALALPVYLFCVIAIAKLLKRNGRHYPDPFASDHPGRERVGMNSRMWSRWEWQDKDETA